MATDMENQDKEQQVNTNDETNQVEEKIEEVKNETEIKEKLEKNIETQDSNKENKEDKQMVKNEDKPEYVVNMMKRRKKIMITTIMIILIVILAIAFSTVFAFLNTGSQNIAKGVHIKNIDISGLSVPDATKKIKDAINIELQSAVQLEYNEYTAEIDPNNIEFSYNIEEAINEAYKIGRQGNLIQNNYELLFSSILSKNIELKETYNDEILNTSVSEISAKIPGVVIEPSYYVENEENKLVIVKGKDGVEVVKNELKSNIVKSIKNRSAQNILNGDKIEKVKITVQNKKADAIDIEKIYNEVKKEPVDAYYEEEPFKIYAQVDGVDFDITLEEAKGIIAEDKEEYEIPLKMIPAEVTINDIGLEAFPYEISSFSTRYDITNVNRTTNLELAAEKINGTVLMPGEVFSYNQVVGKRTIEAGYKNAAIYANGKVEDGLGGGICQISSTLYNSVLLANLGIVERENHSFTTSYVSAGRDATVVYGSIDFQFENTRSYPIKFEATVANGVATISIYGIAEETEYEVKIIPVTTATIPYNVEYIQDNTLAPGQEVVEQYGSTGYKVTTYKELRLNGATISKEVLSNDTYSAMKRIVRVGPEATVETSTDDIITDVEPSNEETVEDLPSNVVVPENTEIPSNTAVEEEKLSENV